MVTSGRAGALDAWLREAAPDGTSHLTRPSLRPPVELRTITLRRVRDWVKKHDVKPHTRIDKRLIPTGSSR